MEIANRFVDECVVLDVSEDRFEYPKTLLLKNHVLHLLQQGHKNLILNLTDVTMLDSFGIAVIISILKMCRSQQGHLALFGLNDTVNRLMEITHMDRVLDIWVTEGQAVHQIKHALKKG